MKQIIIDWNNIFFFNQGTVNAGIPSLAAPFYVSVNSSISLLIIVIRYDKFQNNFSFIYVNETKQYIIFYLVVTNFNLHVI